VGAPEVRLQIDGGIELAGGGIGVMKRIEQNAP